MRNPCGKQVSDVAAMGLALWRWPKAFPRSTCGCLALTCLGYRSLFSANRTGRLIIVGDVHGCSEELKELLEKAQFGSEDELIFVGDLIGKGPSPREVVRMARRLEARAVQGNHEYNLLAWRHRGAPLPDPLGQIKEAYAATVQELEEEDWQWLAKRPLTLKLSLPQPLLVVHAGLVPGLQASEHMS